MPAVTEKRPSPGRRRGRYPKEFRRDVAALVLDQHRSIADVAKELDLVGQSVGNWVRQEKIDRGEREGLTSEERDELNKLRREVNRLSVERELLKRAVACSVGPSNSPSRQPAGSLASRARRTTSGRRRRRPGRPRQSGTRRTS